MGFTTVQSVVALIARSEAMMGDSAAMVVDAFTYGFNLYAERKKNEDTDEESEIGLFAGALMVDGIDGSTDSSAQREKLERHLHRRRRHLHLELVPPLVSVSALLVLIGFVLHESIHTLILDAHRSEKEQSQPNLILMMTSSILNLFLDLMNVACFARAKRLMGYNTDNSKEKDAAQKYGMIDSNDGLSGEIELYEIQEPIPRGSECEEQTEDSTNIITSNEHIEVIEDCEDERVNLNMCSAYTHVFADTLRSIAVITASIIAEFKDSLTPEVADSYAAVIVSIIILVSVLPLFRGLFRTWGELRSITREEQALSDNE
mmetsp:Transcript_33888/g.81945  ORF Transcript_33888/g.81945 Transcript_33888/m.81945 type:complete len:318 (+) Transcript_33888:364-1317(+)